MIVSNLFDLIFSEFFFSGPSLNGNYRNNLETNDSFQLLLNLAILVKIRLTCNRKRKVNKGIRQQLMDINSNSNRDIYSLTRKPL